MRWLQEYVDSRWDDVVSMVVGESRDLLRLEQRCL